MNIASLFTTLSQNNTWTKPFFVGVNAENNLLWVLSADLHVHPF